MKKSGNPTQRLDALWQRRRKVLALRGLLYPMGLSLLILGAGGMGFWMLEPRVHSLGEGLWLAFTTAATVGYGDLVPSTPASRVFAVLVVLTGLAVLSLVTAAVAAMFVESDEKQLELDLLNEITQLRNEVRELRTEIQRSVNRP